MKVFVKTVAYEFDYPEDMEKIINYLENRGKLNVNYKTLQSLYYDFSDDKYCAQWMSVDDQMLKEFMNYLESTDI